MFDITHFPLNNEFVFKETDSELGKCEFEQRPPLAEKKRTAEETEELDRGLGLANVENLDRSPYITFSVIGKRDWETGKGRFRKQHSRR